MEMKGFLKITGVGAYLPSQIVTSDDLMREAQCNNFDVSSDFLRRFSGIEERRFANAEDNPSDLATHAAKMAIDHAGIDAKDIDQVLFCGIERDRAEPATAHTVADNLGIEGADCFDISNACHGIMSGLLSANGTIGIGAAENILICTGEKPSNVTYDILRQLKGSHDKALFKKLMGGLTVGDAGGALLVSRTQPEEGCKLMKFNSISKYRDYCYYKHTNAGVEFQMEMSKISNAVVQMHREMIDDTYSKLGWTSDSIAKVYCHQAGEKPHIKMAELARQPLNKAPITYKKLANLTSATIAVNMHLNPPNYGDRVLIMGAGSGIAGSQVGLIHAAKNSLTVH